MRLLAPIATLIAVALLIGIAQRGGGAEQRERPKPAAPYPTRAATLPPAVRVIDEPDGFKATEDILPGRLRLPSGRVAIDAYFTPETKPLPLRVAPGSYPFHVTTAESVGKHDTSGVALATLVVSDRPTVRWRPAGGIGVDGGVAAFSSAEGADKLADMGDSERWLDRYQDFYDVMDAHGGSAGLAKVDDDTNLAIFSTGLGDGGYGVYVGLDADGRPTRYVVDCGLIHFDWPATPGPAKASPA